MQGCQWIGELSQLDKHLNSNPSQEKQLEGCTFTRVKCLYCSELIQRSGIQVHQSKQCSRRPFSCVYCKSFNSNYEDVTTNHWPKCGHYPVQCTNRCRKSIKRQHLKDHISNDCPLTAVNCEFSHVGCEVKLPRKDMPAHLTNNVVKHISLHAANYKVVVSQLEEENKQLKKQVAKLTQDLKLQQICTPICPAEFTMTNFEQHKIDDDIWFSPPFYTYPKGYKMCLVIFANSYGTYDGTHIALGVHMMMGEFDDQLEWPFRGYIIIRLISQIDDDYKVGIIDFFNLEPDNTAANRVLTEEDGIAEVGRCIHDFISHTDMQPKYLKNDSLILCAYQYTRFYHQ